MPSVGVADAPPAERLRVEAPAITTEDRSFEVHGHDPYGPRSLQLWRGQRDGFAALAVTPSTADGHFAFGPLPLPPNGQRLRVSPVGEPPSEDSEIRIETPPTSPRVTTGGLDPVEISIYPPAPGGTLRIRDAASGRVIWQQSVANTERGPHRLDLDSEGLIQFKGPLLIDHIRADGRISPSVAWPLDPSARN